MWGLVGLVLHWLFQQDFGRGWQKSTLQISFGFTALSLLQAFIWQTSGEFLLLPVQKPSNFYSQFFSLLIFLPLHDLAVVIEVFLFVPQTASGLSETRLARGFWSLSAPPAHPALTSAVFIPFSCQFSLSQALCREWNKTSKKPQPHNQTKNKPLDPKLNQNPGNNPAPLQVVVGAKNSLDIVCTLPCINVYIMEQPQLWL